jgi:hypothetical protein
VPWRVSDGSELVHTFAGVSVVITAHWQADIISLPAIGQGAISCSFLSLCSWLHRPAEFRFRCGCHRRRFKRIISASRFGLLRSFMRCHRRHRLGLTPEIHVADTPALALYVFSHISPQCMHSLLIGRWSTSRSRLCRSLCWCWRHRYRLRPSSDPSRGHWDRLNPSVFVAADDRRHSSRFLAFR